MPRTSAFFGIVITMYHDDRPLPHFHARYGGQSVSIGIDPLTMLAARLRALPTTSSAHGRNQPRRPQSGPALTAQVMCPATALASADGRRGRRRG
jgi:hypothetical protein